MNLSGTNQDVKLRMYVIHLNGHTKRLNTFIEQFKGALTKNAQILRWKATCHKQGWIGCFLSHVNALRFLVSQPQTYSQYPGLYVILEDDCCLTIPKQVFKERFMVYLDYLHTHLGEWNLFVTGGIYPKPTRIVCRDPFIIECDWIVCSQFNIHTDKSAHQLIQYAQRTNIKEGVDTVLAKQNRNKIWIPYPMWSAQTGHDTTIGETTYLQRIQNEFVQSVKTLDKFVQNQT